MSLDEDIAKQKAQWHLKCGTSSNSIRRNRRKNASKRRRYDEAASVDEVNSQTNRFTDYVQSVKHYAPPPPMPPNPYHPGPGSPQNDWYVHNGMTY